MRPDNPNRLAPTVQRDYNYAYFPVLNRFTALRIKPYYLKNWGFWPAELVWQYLKISSYCCHDDLCIVASHFV